MADKIRIPREDAEVVLFGVIKALEKAGIEHHVCGSFRRRTKLVGDVDVVVLCPLRQAVQALAKFCGSNETWNFSCETNLDKAEKAAHCMMYGFQVDLYVATEENVGAMRLFLTGDAQFNVIMRTIAKKQGLKLNQYGIWQGDELLAAKTEEQMFECLGIPFVSPLARTLTGPKKNWPIHY